MQARLKSLTLNADGTQSVTLTVSEDLRDFFDDHHERLLDFEIRPYHSQRSKISNAYFHVLCNNIAVQTGESDDEVKERLVREYGVIKRGDNGEYIAFRIPNDADAGKLSSYAYTKFYDQIVEDGVVYNCFFMLKPTHEMNSQEMARLIDGAIAEAKELGIDTEPPVIKEEVIADE